MNAADFLVGAGGGSSGRSSRAWSGRSDHPGVSALSGGLMTIAGVIVIGAALPGFRRYRAPDSATGTRGAGWQADEEAPAPS